MKTQGILAAALATAAVASIGCGSPRTPDQYTADTRALLETKSGAIKGCYDAALAHGAKHAGTVIVHFTVAPQLGTINAVVVDPRSTNTPVLQECVTKNLEGLTLAPADDNLGTGTFTWEFTVGPTPPPAIAPAG